MKPEKGKMYDSEWRNIIKGNVSVHSAMKISSNMMIMK